MLFITYIFTIEIQCLIFLIGVCSNTAACVSFEKCTNTINILKRIKGVTATRLGVYAFVNLMHFECLKMHGDICMLLKRIFIRTTSTQHSTVYSAQYNKLYVIYKIWNIQVCSRKYSGRAFLTVRVGTLILKYFSQQLFNSVSSQK